MKSGMIAAETLMDALSHGEDAPKDLTTFTERLKGSWLGDELYTTRNFAGFMHKFGYLVGAGLVWIDQNILAASCLSHCETRSPTMRV